MLMCWVHHDQMALFWQCPPWFRHESTDKKKNERIYVPVQFYSRFYSDLSSFFVHVATSKKRRGHFFFSITHISISQSPFIKKRPRVHALIQHKAADRQVSCFFSTRSFIYYYFLLKYCFVAFLIRLTPPPSSPVWALVDCQWEISASGGAAVTWSPPFIKYLPAHSQHCTLLRVAPTSTQRAHFLYTVQSCTVTPKHQREPFILLWSAILSTNLSRISEEFLQ